MDIPVHSIAALRKGYAEGRWSVKAVAEAALARAAAAEAVDPAIWIARVRARAPARRRRGARRQRPRRPAAVRRSVRGQGQHRRRRTADHRRLPRFRLSARAFGDRGRAPARGRRAARRQDQSRPVRHRPRRRALALRRAAQPVRCALRFRRLELRLGGRGVARPRQFRARHRHCRFGPRPGRVLQSDRPQAEPRIDQRRRRRAGLPVARLRLDLRHQRRRRGGGAVGGGRASTPPTLTAARR